MNQTLRYFCYVIIGACFMFMMCYGLYKTMIMGFMDDSKYVIVGVVGWITTILVSEFIEMYIKEK